MIGHIPEDVLWNILICLPAKQVAQMRCVSKQWNALLSQPSFIKSHLDHHLTHDEEILLVFIFGEFSTRYPVTAHPSRSPDLQIPNLIQLPKVETSSPDKSHYLIGSTNGLICFSSSEDAVHIWNPSLSALASLPYSPLDDNDHMQFRFGHDPINDDYKVVKVMFRLGSSNPYEIQGSIKVEVYSLKRGGCWQSVTEFPSHISFICNLDEVCIDGHLYWNCYVNDAWTRNTIVEFDLGAETFSEISLPDSISCTLLGALFQKLCVISCFSNCGCEVWLLVDHKWVKHNVISQLHCSNIDPIGFTSKNEFLFTTIDGHLAFYDPGAAEIKWFTMNTRDSDTKVVEYVESLVWPPSLRI